MKKLLLLASTVIALLATSCSKSGSEKTETQQDGYIRVASSIVGENTKAITAPNAQLTDILFVRADAASGDGTGLTYPIDPVIYGKRDAATAITFTTTPAQVYDKATDNQAFFVGFHPKPKTTAVTEFHWTIDGRTDILQTDIWNAGKYSAPSTGAMRFHHLLTRVEIVAVSEAGIADAVVKAGWGKITKITVETGLILNMDNSNFNQLPVAQNQLLLSAGAAYAADFASADITTSDYTNAPVIAGAMIGVPTTATSTVTLKVTTEKVAEQDVIATVTPGNLTASKIHKFTLTFGTPDKPIKATASTIEDWSGGDPGTGTVVPPAIP